MPASSNTPRNVWPTCHMRYARRDDGSPCLVLQQWWTTSFKAVTAMLPPENKWYPGEWRDVPIVQQPLGQAATVQVMCAAVVNPAPAPLNPPAVDLTMVGTPQLRPFDREQFGPVIEE